MKLDKLIKIRKKHKVSRAKLALDIDVTVAYIKKLETEELDSFDTEVLNKIADYFNMSIEDLLEGPIVNITPLLSREMSLSQVTNMVNTLLDKYDMRDKNFDRDKFLAEFKYRIGDLDTEVERSKSSSLEDILNDIEEDMEDILQDEEITFMLDDKLGFTKEAVDSIRRDARVVATFYKELLVNRISPYIALNIVRIFMSIYFD